VFDGSLSPLVAHFAKSRRLTPGDLKELEALLRASRKPR
jgi:predicted transcriptional regulator